MTTNTLQLSVPHSSEFQLLLTCTPDDNVSGIINVHIRCRFLHPGGHFEYDSAGLVFAIEPFLHFAEALAHIRQGNNSPAQLQDVGKQFLFEIKPSDTIRRLVDVKLEAKEYVPSMAEAVSGAFTTKLDYDLYVNKLYDSLLTFNRDLQTMASLD
jgi:hypothetical protein